MGIGRKRRNVLKAAAEFVVALKLEVKRLADAALVNRIAEDRGIEANKLRPDRVRVYWRVVAPAIQIRQVIIIKRRQLIVTVGDQFAVNIAKRVLVDRIGICCGIVQHAGALAHVDRERARCVDV